MKPSRKRFAEFRANIKRGLLDLEKVRKPGEEPPPNIGGHHRPPAGKHEFKLKKTTLIGEYRVLLRGYFGWVAGLISIVILTSALSLVTPWVLKVVIDYVIPGKPLPWFESFPSLAPAPGMPTLNFMVLLMIAAAVLGTGLEWIRALSIQHINFRLAGTLRQKMHDHLARLSLAKLSDYKTGGIVTRIMGDVDGVVGGLQNAILTPASAAFRIIASLVILFINDWRLCMVAALFIPPLIAVHFLLFRRLRPLWRNIQDDRSTLSGRLTDMFGGIRVVRSFRRERTEGGEFAAAQNTMIRKQRFTAIVQRLLATGWTTFVPAIGVVIIWYGGKRVLWTQEHPGEGAPLTLGDLMMFQGYVMMLLGPITQLIESMQNVQQNLASMDRMIDVLNQPLDMPDKKEAQEAPQSAGHLALRDVHFGYNKEKEVIRGISVEVPAGKTLAIVGPSGSGKTTLVNLVARFFDPQTGAILLDGVDIREFRLESYRSLIAMVLQDVYLFDGTVADNIAYGKRHATPTQIEEAAKKANAHEFISEMEKKYDTVIGERGNRLSGGQKQRISIARAILADPRILILDEATSSLDSKSERMIQESLRELMAGRTTLVIAHRLSTIMHADAIVVIEEGRIVERGTHEELLARGGVYHSMFTQQFERHRDPVLERIDWEQDSRTSNS